MDNLLDDMIPEERVAEIRDCSVVTLRRERRLGTGPRFIKLGRKIFYSLSDLREWIEAMKASSLAEFEARRREAKR